MIIFCKGVELIILLVTEVDVFNADLKYGGEIRLAIGITHVMFLLVEFYW
jgi:hypothetical protein